MNNPIHLITIWSVRIASLVLLGILATGCSTGSAVITGQKRPPISPESVHLYSSPPQQPYEEIGIISANSYWSWAWNEQAKMDTATREIRVKAAKLGANGIILKSLGSEPITGAGMSLGSGLYGGSINSMRTMDGIAIYIPASSH
jgi:hypothetical protein